MHHQFSRKNAEFYSFLLVLFGSVFLAFMIIKPYINVLLVAGVGAIGFGPMYDKILSTTRKNRSVAALLTILIISIIVIIPLVIIGQNIFYEARGLYNQLDQGGEKNIGVIENAQIIITEKFGDSINIDPQIINRFISNTVKYLYDQGGSFVSSTIQIIVRIAIGIFALYYFLKDRDRIREYFISVSPLGEKYTKEIIDRLKLTIHSTIRGSIVVALLQSIFLGVGLFVFGVPNAFLWGSVGFIAALVPAIGTSLVTIPVITYLLVEGTMLQAIGFAIWGVGFVGIIDNVIRPKLVGHHTGLHPFLVFISVIGGIGFFGVTGILWGPIILSLLSTTLESYAVMSKDSENKEEI